MQKEFIPYEQALELKELGYNENYIAYYQNDGKLCQGEMWVARHAIKAPLYQQAFRWFREEYSTSQYVQKFETKFFCCVHDGNSWSAETFDTYEEAELACIKKLIEIAKNK